MTPLPSPGIHWCEVMTVDWMGNGVLAFLAAVGIAALVLHWPVYLCYVCTVVEEVIKMLVGLPRYRSGKWMNDLNHGVEA